jgi:nucleotide-binding universal stress UspA family protein
MRGPVVVGVDGSDAGLLALEEAASMISGTERSLLAVFVRHIPCVAWSALNAGVVWHMESIVDETQNLAEAECCALLGVRGVRWHFEVGRGAPASELMRAATRHESDTIVVAGRRHGTFGGFASGAVATRLMHRWPGTLVVLHTPSRSKSSPTVELRPAW